MPVTDLDERPLRRMASAEDCCAIAKTLVTAFLHILTATACPVALGERYVPASSPWYTGAKVRRHTSGQDQP
jgi:hypothetical protein